MNSRTLLSMIGVLAVAASAALTALTLSGPGPTAPAADAKPVTVAAHRPQRRTFVRKLSLPGTLEPLERAVLYAKLTGYLEQIRVDRGERVRGPVEGRPGQLLAVIAVPEMRAELAVLEANKDEADAAVLLAQADLQTARQLKLEASATVTAADAKIDQVRAGIAVLRADRAKAAAEAALAEFTGKRLADLRRSNSVTDLEAREAETRTATALAARDAVDARVGLLEAETRAAQAAREEATARVAGAEAKIAAAEASLQVARARRAIADARIEQARVMMQYSEIRAPFDGVVLERWTDRGTFIQAGTSSRTTALLEVVRDDVLRVFLDVPEPDVPFLRTPEPGKPETGSPVEIAPHAFPGTTYQGHVVRTAGGLAPGTRTLRVEVELNNPPRPGRTGEFLLKPGMFAAVAVVLDVRKNALGVPGKALQVREGRTGVFVVRDNRAAFAPVTTGYDDGAAVEILHGLTDADVVVVGAAAPLADGTVVATDARSGR